MLAPGTRLGPYELVERLAAGGMGEVYRARDTRLGRDVALKVLPPHLADADARRRFEQEARVASALSHPNIVTIFDVGDASGIAYLAMELVDGRTLRAMVENGALPIALLLRLAVQIADALAAAHARGIVHRDLKPENVLVTPDGLAKILDFGLAKAVTPSGQAADTILVTQAGAIVGTAGYMSPEQARGEQTDARSDQFAFGAILYELASGRRAFARGSVIQTASAVITDDPAPLEPICPHVPPPLLWTIRRCLSKRPHDRYDSTADLHRDLVAVSERLSGVHAAGRGAVTGLPHFGTPLVGRHAEIDAIASIVSREDVRWLTLTGPGGVGKTRLAVQAACELAERFQGGVTFVPLGEVTEWRLVASAIADAFETRPDVGEAPLDALKRALRFARAPLLLVVDNFEHVADAAPVLTELLDAAPAITVLATSRSVLHVYGEHEYSVPPLELPDRRQTRADALDASPAVALFVQRATAARPDFRLTDEHAPAVGDICRRLDGLPMAIELAAARIKLLPPAALLARLEGRLLSLAGGARDLPARQQTLRNAIDWSYGLLTAEEQRLFRRLAVFVGGWTLESAEAVCDAKEDLRLDVLDGIASLVDKSLVRREDPAGGEPRFTMLETLREYGLERLREAGEDAITRRAHAAYCLVLVEETGDARDAAAQAAWIARCDAELANIRAALQLVVETGHVEWALRLMLALFQFWHTRGLLVEARDWLLAALRLPDDGSNAALRGRAMVEVSSVIHLLGDYADATTQARAALAMFREMDHPMGIAMALNAIGIIRRNAGDGEGSKRAFEEALAQWRELGDDQAVARMLSNLASVFENEDDHDAARRAYADCRAIFQRLGDDAGVAWSLTHEGDVLRGQRRLDEARALHEDALHRFRHQQDLWGISGTLMALGRLACDAGDAAAARRHYAEALDILRRLGDPRTLARAIEASATATMLEGDARRALTLAGAAAALRQTIGAQLPLAERAALDTALEPARQAPDAAAAWMDGWSMSIDEAIALALAPPTSR